MNGDFRKPRGPVGFLLEWWRDDPLGMIIWGGLYLVVLLILGAMLRAIS